ncbi:hypothetical protein HIM_02238 [Hirsutella minnesotensis 3608]|nr:hypothetical protein HIM_02238 [Hirsutella minnesotensis 3608]
MTSQAEKDAFGSRPATETPLEEVVTGSTFVERVYQSDIAAPEAIEACVHSLIKRITIEQPSSPAICSWDGELTYHQLDLLSSRLAHRLVGLGVRPGSTVISCFEKSLLAPVAILAVAKAGGASIALDVSQSQDDLRAIIAQVSCPVVLSSPGNSQLAQELAAGDVIVLDEDLLPGPEVITSNHVVDLPIVSPSDTFIVLFIPGDAGSHLPPTGVAVSHRDMSTAILYRQKDLGYSKESRIFDIAPQGSYVAWCNLLHTLIAAGCLCIPSEHDRRHDIESSMGALRANAAHLTPAAAELLNHSKIAEPIHLTFVGEPESVMTEGEGDQDQDCLTFSELSKLLAIGAKQVVSSSKAEYTDAWVVDALEGSSTPVHFLGEIWLEGPLAGNKFPIDALNSTPVFFKKSMRSLCRSLSRHQRTEGASPLSQNGDRSLNDGFESLNINHNANVDDKPDCDQSAESVGNSPSSSESDGAVDTPETEQGDFSDTLQLMQTLWAQVLQVSPGSISKEANFFKSGGDAIKALRLSRLAKEKGLTVSVRDVCRSSSLWDLSTRASSKSQTSTSPVPPFSLLPSVIDHEDSRAQVAQLCRIQKTQVLDLLPCSPLQEGMLALTQRLPGSYVEQHLFEIEEGVDINRFRQAWDQVVAMNPILRTQIISLPNHGLMQAVLEQGPYWATAADMDEYRREHAAVHHQMGLGTPLSRFAIIGNGDRARPSFLWEVHHALYDGWSFPLIMNEAEQAYYGEAGQELDSMAGFIKYIQDRDEQTAKTFWRAQFEGIQEVHYPVLKASMQSASSASHMSLGISKLDWGRSDFTQATIARAAWAIVMARCGNSIEALYGVTVTGRQAPIPNIEKMAGPAIATVPVRVPVDWESSARHLLEAVQGQAADMIPFEQTGLQKIRRMGKEAATACSFRSLLVVQPAEDEGAGDGDSRPFLCKPNDSDQATSESAPPTYAIEVECQLGSDEARLRIDYDSGIVSTREMQTIVQTFEHVLRQLADESRSQDKIGVLAPLSLVASSRLEEVYSWNAKVPDAVEDCVHNLILQRVHESPLSQAICAWDGELTYQQLDEQSTKLAFQLVAKGVKDRRVPVLFEKSLWMPVTVLAVMKAGGALVALEKKEPEERLQAIISKADSPVLLSSVQNAALAKRLVKDTKEVVIVGGSPNGAAPEPDHSTSVLPSVSPSSLLYVVFTSGSTGTPKGVLISHRNFCSALAYQQHALDYSRESRVLDFASCAFDVSWSNLFNTLTAGACFCIPSPNERENDLAGCLVKYKITLADLTPSVARALGSDALSGLTTMVLGGEGPLASDASLAGKKTHVINAYGPAECTPTATLSTLDPANVCIGRGMGLCTWIVEPEHAESLTPVGDVGELWLEGPLVGDGYLEDPDKTAAAFIQDPVWLHNAVGRRGRLYRSGDLVRYKDDGSLVFIGRKDTQVKIRGQRVELGEIETCIGRLITGYDKVQVVAETIQPEGVNNPILVAFVSLSNADAMTEEEHAIAVLQTTNGLSERLRETLPSYMVPATYLPVRTIPVTNAGKIDRRLLRVTGVSLWPQYRGSQEKKDESSQPVNEMEGILQSVWMSVLNLSADEASVEAGFASLGGDSISAMQLVSRCRLHNIMFTVSDILQANTIRKLAARYKPMSDSAAKLLEEAEQLEQEDSTAEFSLSPMQASFFKDYPDGLNHFNQSFLLDLGLDVSATSLREALQSLVSRHAMLRARFNKDPDSGIWTQSIAEDDEDAFIFAEHSIKQKEEVGKAGQWRQENMNICDGPVFACDLFNMPDGNQIVLLSAHHLVVDLVSWRIVWNDVEEFIKHGEIRSPKTLSFRTWCTLQERIGSNLSPLSVLPYPIPEPEIDFWGMPVEEYTFGECDSFDVTLPQDVTKLLFSESNTSLRTEALDLILGALSYSFLHTFPERSVPAIWIEGHGREQLDGVPTDVSATVGWFTTMYPLAVTTSIDQPVTEAVRLVKDTRRKVPNMGLPFYACQHYSESGRQAFQGHDVYELIFNFTGRFQQLEREEGLFKSSQGSDEPDLKISEISKSARRCFMIEIGAVVADNMLVVSFNYHNGMKHLGRIQKWTQTFIDNLEIAARGLAQSPVAFTLSDLPLLQLSYRGLDALLQEQLPKMDIKPSDVATIYPCSPLQEGMLLSSLKGAASYITYTIWRCVVTEGVAPVCPRRLEEAWKKVVSRHTILSTVFALHPEGHGFIQIVLENPIIRVTHIDAGHDTPTVILGKLPEPSFAPNEPEYALTICQSQTGEVACRLDMSHALTDAHSAGLILTELASAYEGAAMTSAPPFSDMIRYINSTPRAQIVASWTSLLDGIAPCEFPLSVTQAQQHEERFTEISCSGNFTVNLAEFCKRAGVMSSALLQLAWGMVLSHMTGMSDVCFGYLTSGRDATVKGVENMAGPLANLLISRVDLRGPARQVLEMTSERAKQHMAIQHVSLAEVQHHLGLAGRRLFNTSLSIRPAEKEKAEKERGLSFDIGSGGDAHEFDIKCNASINGTDVDLSIEFREPFVSREVAMEASSILHQAIEYIVSAVDVGLDVASSVPSTSTTDAEMLSSGFFRHTMGVDETTAASFWELQFAQTQGTHFPLPKSATYQARPDSVVSLDLKALDLTGDDYPPDVTVRAAWAILTARLMCADESIFGSFSPGGQTTTPLPTRIVIDLESNIRGLLGEVQRQASGIAQFQRMGKDRIRRLNDDAVMACNFQTLLAVQHESDKASWQNLGAHPLIVKICLGGSSTYVEMTFDSQVIQKSRAQRIIHEFEHVLRQVLDRSQRDEKVGSVNIASQRDLEDIWTWNASLPDLVEGRVHDLILQHARDRPQAPAIHAWDGTLTYDQLDDLSCKLAKTLIGKGVGPGSIVPLCFEKSMWTPVAALAVMRAGGASVAVDTSQPEERIRTITSQVFTGLARPKVLLSSVANDGLVRRLDADHVLTLGHENLPISDEDQALQLPLIHPSDLLYVVFTSGSTGKPKGVLITHKSFYTAITYQRDALGVQQNSRVFDFSSYAFDVAWLSLLKTLTAGACLCIPSAAEREDDLGGCLERYDITVVDLTPSVARAIEPKSALSRLSTLILGGEAVLGSDADLGGAQTQVTVAYGPAECTPTSTIMDLSKTRDAGIGTGVGMCTWVVDIENPNVLAPVGAVGELWLEGPLIGNGYLHEPAKTEAAFVKDPLWLLQGVPNKEIPGREGRVYRTGDLVQYQEDGSLLFMGRKDTQVKIRGQRVELGDIEHHVLQAVETAVGEAVTNVQVVVETVQPKGIANKMLVAFVALECASGDLSSGNYEDFVRQVTAGIPDQLGKALPVFMVPSLFIPIRAIPMSATGKTDRRRLQEIGSSLSAKDVKALSRSGEQRRPPQTEAELAMQALWADILNMDPEGISADDSFFRIGGDSIGAMRLVGMARYKGFNITVRDVFQSPVLSDLSAVDISRPTMAG